MIHIIGLGTDILGLQLLILAGLQLLILAGLILLILAGLQLLIVLILFIMMMMMDYHFIRAYHEFISSDNLYYSSLQLLILAG